jgi:heat shock protein HslJ
MPPFEDATMKRLLLLALPLALAACTRPAEPATPPADATPAATTPAAPSVGTDASLLPKYHWRLSDATDGQGQRIAALFARPDQPVQLDFRDGRVGVSNTCNRMGGTYTVADGSLTVGRLVSTQMACADGAVMALDQEVGKRLEGTLKMATTAGETPTLTLTTATGDMLAFTAEPTAETRYGGTGERMFLEVAADTKPCSHPLIPDKQCLQVREIKYDDKGLKVGTPGEFQHFYDSIEGYTHEPGIRNVLRVDRYTVKNAPADASSKAYVLDMVVESASEKQ